MSVPTSVAPTPAGSHGPRHDPDLERQRRDIDTLERWVGWRWAFIASIGALLLAGRVLRLHTGGTGAVVGTIGSLIAIHLLLLTMLRRGRLRRAQTGLLAAFDLVVAGAAVAYYGPGGLLVTFVLAILPQSFDQRARRGDLLALAGSLTYVAAAVVHNAWVAVPGGAPFALAPSTLVEALAFVLVAMTLTRLPASLVARIGQLRSVLEEVAAGQLALRAPAEQSDETGLLEREVNRMLDTLGSTMAQVQREADELAALADVLATDAAHLLEANQEAAAAITRVASELHEQRDLADASAREGTAAKAAALDQSRRSEEMERSTRTMAEAATHGQDHAARAGETLRSLEEDIQSAGATVEALRTLSARTAELTQTMGKIARRTRLLALNAAIEAARAGEHGTGFGAVADQVRQLAGEASQAARDVADVVARISADVDRVGAVVGAGTDRVGNVGAVAEQTRVAWEELR
ncbi:MAG: methyl-accepting chemotaxis protein, partial [Gemmatimonadales bacterium]